EWARSDEDATAHVDADAKTPAIERPRLLAPPLKLDGFVPSAFSTGEETRAPDTSILGKLPVPLIIHSGDALHYANDEFLHLTGYDTLDELTDAGGLGALFADPYAQFEDGTADESDRALRLKTRDGQEFPIDAILRAVPWRAGKALMLVVRRSGEEDAAPAHFSAANDEPTQQPDVSELKSRIAEMRTIIDTATDGVVLIGRDGNIRSISRPAEALFGFDSDEVAGKPFASLFAIESQRAARDYLSGLSEPGVASVLNDGREVIGRESQGRFIPLFMTIGRLPSDSGFCAVVRDITQWKRAEEDLTQARAVAERASSQKTDFLARISHEIRTPLNAIIGFSELMVDEKFGPVANDRYRDYLRDINRSGNHVLDLVNDLLDISKIEAGQQEMDYEAVSLNDTLAETVAMMQPQANRERVIIRSSFASRLPEVVADLRSVRQIALNILSNAIRYTQAGGQVIVSTAYETSGDVVMRVRDTGIGMSQAEIEQALKPFKQINALKRGRGDGTGLGLPLTKAMVEANRARFSITSTPGEGTLVEVAFPSTRVLAE
ncbi:histidine kinase dimerization/phospho-acceptor domain-containing protein, partial [Mesorhizobium sp.]